MSRPAFLGLFWSLALLVPALPGVSAAPAPRDGRLFDQGRSMEASAEGAPQPTGRASFYLGQFDVEYSVFSDDTLAHLASGVAEVSLMNRGHAFMERFFCPDFDGQGHALHATTFLMHNPADAVWVMGIANSYTENITVYHGDFDGSELVMRTAIRRGGGQRLANYRAVFEGIGDEGFDVVFSESVNDSAWRRSVVKAFRRRAASDDFMATAADYGTPAADLPPEARQFDFLIGEWEMSHRMTFPNGQKVAFPSNGTGAFALGGHAVMEHSWYDVDPNLPDAATTIIRIYNRAMRRWECMYTTNRFNGILHFGGVKEDDKIILHPFESDAGAATISYWTFHDMTQQSYGWYANTSRDRGASFEKTWIIEATRKEQGSRER